MKSQTAGFINGDTGFARLFRFAKYGFGNVNGTALSTPHPHIIRIDRLTAGNSGAVSTTVVVKPYSSGAGTNPRVAFTTNTPVLAGLELYIEETSTHWVLIGKQQASGDRLIAELVSPRESGFAEPVVNDAFTYVPTGHLVKPLSSGTKLTTTTTVTDQWIKLATITTRANFSRYTALLSVTEAEAITVNSATAMFSLQVLHQNTVSAPVVSLTEVTTTGRRSLEAYYVSGVAAGVGTTELWVKSLSAFSTIGLAVLSETALTDTLAASVQYHDASTWTGTAPTSPVRAKYVLDSFLTYSSGWAAASGFGGVKSTGVQISGRMAVLNMTVTGGTTADNTTIATVGSPFAPQSTIEFPCVVTDATGVHSIGRLLIFNTGTIRIVGGVASNNRLSASACWNIAGF